jgi:hypothetical protein
MRPRLVLSNNVGGHTATVLDVDALFPGPAANRGRVDGAVGAATAGPRLDVPPVLRAWSMYVRFITGWLASDPDRLAASLLAFVGHPAYGTQQLRQDLDRFAFLLGGNDGEPLFGPGQH